MPGRRRFQSLGVEALEARQVLAANFADVISDRWIDDESSTVVSFQIVDSTVPASALTVTATSNNGFVIGDDALELSNLGDNRWLLFAAPTLHQFGTAKITLSIFGDGSPVSASFDLHVSDLGSGYGIVSSEWFGAFSTVTGSSAGLTIESTGTDADHTSSSTVAGPEDTASEWIVRLTEEALAHVPTLQEAADFLTVPEIGMTVVAGLGLPGQMLVRATGALADVQDYFRSNTALRYFELNTVISSQAVPNDPSYASLYGLHNTGQTGGVIDADIDAPEAWNITTGSRSIVVGIIDTGIDYNHLDLAANVWTNPGEIAGNSIDDDQNGFIDDIHGFDFVNNDGDPMDDHYHGTHVAGTIGAVGNNSLGVVGVNWQTSMMGLKFLDAGGRGTTANAIRAVNYATVMKSTYGVNIRLTNNSWGGGSFDQGLLDAINAGGAQDILFIAAAGNDGLNIEADPHYPASYNSQYIVSVAATDASDTLAYFSNYGATQVDLAAPGVSTYSTAPNNSYQSLSGTSMATPHVSGVAALALSVNPSLTAAQLKAALLNNVDVVPALVGKTLTGGRLNAQRVLEAMGLSVTATSPAAGSVVQSKPTSFTVDFSASYDGASIAASDFQVNGIAASSFTLTDANTVTFTFSTSPVTAPGLQTMTMAAGAVSRLSDGGALAAYSGSFRYDDVVLAPISTTPATGSIVALPFTTLDVQFNEAFDLASIGAADLTLSQGTVIAATALNATTVRYTLAGITSEGTLTYAFAAGALIDVFGSPSAAYGGSFTIDIGTVALPTPSPVGLLGSLVYQTSSSGTITGSGDIDAFTLNVEAGQIISAVAHPNAVGLRPSLELRSPAGVVLATATASAAGKDVGLEGIVAATTGAYTFHVSGAAGTSGALTIQVTLNAAQEAERTGGATNDTLATAQSLDGTFTSLGSNVSRAAVMGTVTAGSVTVASEGFENGFPGTAWTTYSSTANGRIQVASVYGVHGGANALYMDTSSGSTLNEAVWTVNLAGRTQATLSFWHSEQGDEETAFSGNFTGHYNADGVAISADGVTWIPLWNAATQSTGAWTQYSFDLAAAAAAAGISLTANFKIKFQQYDDNPLPTDGRAWDDISITVPAPTDVDWYKFTLAAGESASLVLKGLPSANVVVRLYDTNGNLIANDVPNTIDSTREVLNYEAPAAGAYYAAVTTTTESDYQLSVLRNAQFESRSGSTIASAQPLGAASGAVLGYLPPSGGLGRLYAFDSSASMIREIHPTTGAILNSFATPVSATTAPDFGLATTPTSLLAAGISTSPIYELNPSTGAVIRTIANPGISVSGLAYSNGEIFVRSDDTSTITVLNYSTGAVVRTFTASGNEALAAGTDYLYSTSGSTLYTLNLQTGALVSTRTLSASSSVEGLGVIGDELYVSDFNFITVYNRQTLAVVRTITGLNDLEAVGADGGDVVRGDYYSLTLNAGSVLQLLTSTPGDAPGEFSNWLDPLVEVYDSLGALVASNDNGAGDARNASLSYTAIAAGTYYVRVIASSAAAGTSAIAGEYLLSYSGAAGNVASFSVASTTPAAGTKVVGLLNSLTVKFSDAVDLTSLAAADLTINGVAATGVTISGTDGAVFTFAEPPRGMVTFALAAGSIVDLQQTPLAAFSGQVNYQLNSAPVLTATPAPTFTSIVEDGSGQSGMLVSELLATGAGGNPIADVDVGDGPGIAVVASDTTKGTWEYSLNNGGTWTALGTVSSTAARLLAADAQTRIRFTPTANAFGTVTTALTFRAWDQSTGANGATADVGAGGGISAFSTATAAAALTVVAVNDAPSFTKGANISISSDGSAKTYTSWATSISQGPSETGQTLTFLVTNDNNALFSVQPTISSTGTLTFTPILNASGTATVSVRLQDNGGTANGGVDTSAVQTFTITLNAPPTSTVIGSQTINEDGTTGILTFTVSDPDTPLTSLTVSTTSTNTTLVPTSSRVLTNLGNGNYQLVITPAANQSGAATIGYSVYDGFLTVNRTFVLTVNAVNDAPSFVKGADVTVAPNSGTQTISGWATSISQGASETGQTLTFQVTTDNPSLFSGQPAINSSGTLTFVPNATLGTATVSVVLKDNGGTANGGGDTSAIQTFKITVANPPRIISSSLQQGDVSSPGALSVVIGFDQPMLAANLDVFDFTLQGLDRGTTYSPISYTYDAGATAVTVNFVNLPEDRYTLTLLSGNGQFESAGGLDLDGEAVSWPIPSNVSGNGAPGGNFVVPFTIDVGTTNFTTPLVAQSPLGSLVYGGAVSGDITAAGDTDTYTITLDAGQTITLTATPNAGSGLQPTLVLKSPSGTVLATQTASAAGKSAILSSISVAVAGTYSIELSGAASTTGLVDLRVWLNAGVESENLGGPTNDSLATAQNIDAQILSVSGGASRGAIIGSVTGSAAGSTTLSAIDSGWWNSLGSHTSSNNNYVVGYGSSESADRRNFFVFDLASVSQSILTAQLRLQNPSSGYTSSDASESYALFDVSTALAALQGSGSGQTAIYTDLGTGVTYGGQTVTSASNGQIVLVDLNAAGLSYLNSVRGSKGVIGGAITTIVGTADQFVFGYTAGTETRQLVLTYAAINAVDYYAFTLAAGERATIGLKQLTGLGTTISLLDAGGATLASGAAGASFDQAISDFVAPAAGTYYIAVNNATNSSTYNLVVAKNAAFDNGANNSVATAQNITATPTALGYVNATSDYYSIQIAGASLLTISTTTPGDGPGQFVNNLNPAVDLYDSTGKLLASNDDGAADGRNATLNYIASGGTYTIRVRATSGSGEYVLGIAQSSPGAPPTISPIADVSIAEDATAVIDFTVTDSDTPLNQLVVSVSSSDSTLLPASGVTLTDLGGGAWRLSAAPAANQYGPVTVTVAISNSEAPVTQSFVLNVRPVNDAPSFTKGADLSVPGLAGAQSVAGWATNLSTGANDAGQTLDFIVSNDNNGLFSVQPTITPAGTLQYTLSGLLGTAVVSVRLHDDGGSADGGVDTSTVQTFTIEVSPPPQIVGSSLQQGAVVSVGALSYVVTFSGAMKASNLDATDFKLHGNLRNVDYVPTGFSYNPGATSVTLDFASLPEDSYTLTLLSGDGRFENVAGRDLDGEPLAWPIPGNVSGDGIDGGNFSVNFSVDGGAVAIPSAFTADPLPGSTVYRSGSAAVYIADVADTDDVTVNLDAGQSFSALITSSAGLQAAVSVYAPGGQLLGTYSAAAVGGALGVQSIAAVDAGVYTLRITGVGGTLGSASVVLTLNAALETESVAGPANSNDSRATAQNLDGAFTDLGGGAARAAVTGAGGTRVLPSENFESGLLGAAWSTYSSLTGTNIRLGNANGVHGGSYALYMDAATSSYTLNEAVWSANLADLTNATLTFWHAEFNDEENPLAAVFTGHANGDGVAISADGNTWYRLWDPVTQNSGVWTQYSFDLVAAAATAGISLNSDFKIKFQQYDDFAMTTDGRAWDDITLTTTNSDADYYSLTLAAGESLSVALKKQSGVGAPQVMLQDGAGTVVASGTTGGGIDSAIHNFVAPTAGTYYLAVAGSLISPYTVAVTRNAAFDGGANANLATAQNIGALRTVVGYADASSDFYSVHLSYDTTLTLATSLPGAGTSAFDNTLFPGVELFDSAGNSLGSNAGGAADGRNALLTRIVAAGDYKLRVYAASNAGEYVLRVSEGPASASPTVSGLTDVTINEDGVATLDFSVSDVDTPSTKFVVGAFSGDATLLPAGNLAVTDLGGGNYRLVAAPAANRYGTVNISVSVSDGSPPIVTTFALHVAAVNDAPSFSKGADQTSRSSGAVSIPGWATAISQGALESGQALTFQLTVDNPAFFAVAPAITPDGTLTYTPSGMLGTALITVVLKDDAGTASGGADTSAPQSFTVTFIAAPTISSVADQTVLEDGEFTVDFRVDDLDTSLTSLVVGATSADQTLLPNAGLTLTDLGGGNFRLSGRPAADRNGATTISLTASDGFGAPTVRTFALNVTAVNDAPSFNLGANQTIGYYAGAQAITNFASSVSAGPFETGQVLTFEVTTDNPSLFTVAPAITGSTLTYTPSGILGSANVTVRLHDNAGTADGGQDTSVVKTFKIDIVAGGIAGALDTSFDGDGILMIPSSLGSFDQGRAVARQADGKLIVVGNSLFSSSSNNYSTIVRYNVDGTLDTSFGAEGAYVTATGIRLTAVKLTADGRILLAGEQNTSTYVTRLTAAGTLDTSFGLNGVRTVSTGNTAINASFNTSLAIAGDGSIAVAKYSSTAGAYKAAVVRLTAGGSLDTSFGGGPGYVLVSFLGSLDTPSDLAFQADGKIVVVGTTNSGQGSTNDYFVARLTSNGALDTTFNVTGFTRVNVGTSTTSADTASRVAIQTDGKIVVSGSSSADFSLIRLNSNGTLDTTFDADGKVTTNISGTDAGAALALQADGKIVVGGSAASGTDLAIARYTSAGALDTTFGTAGKATYSISTGLAESISAMLLDGSGNIVGVGNSADGTNSGDILVARWDATGLLDKTFNDKGWNAYNFGIGHSRATATLALSDGRILLAGILVESGTSTSSGRAVVWMLRPDGSLDTSFGVGGYYRSPSGVSSITAVTVQSDGKILFTDSSQNRVTRLTASGTLDTTFGVSGSLFFSQLLAASTGIAVLPDDSLLISGQRFNSTTSQYEFAIYRFTASGAVDTTFGGGGLAAIDVGSGDDFTAAIALQSDGKIIIAGYSTQTTDDFSVVRLNADGSLDTSFAGTGKLIIPVSTSTDRVRSILVQNDGKIVLAGQTSGDIALVRLLTDGTLDPTFGSGGIVVSAWSTSTDDVTSIRQSADGKLLGVGWGLIGTSTKVIVARYNTDGALDSMFGVGGLLKTPLGPGLSQAYAADLQTDGKLLIAGYAYQGLRNDALVARYWLGGTAGDAPAIAPLGPQNVNENGVSAPIDVYVSHPSLPADSLTLTASGGAWVPPSGFTWTNLGNGHWQVTIAPVANTAGDALITLTTSDGTLSYASTFNLHINALPVVDLNGPAAGVDFATTFIEDASSQPISSPDLALGDSDGTTLTSALVTITNLLDGDAESLSAAVGGTGITASYAAGVLSLNGTASLADYRQVLGTVSYRNTSQSPTAATRLLTFVVSDGSATSRTATSAVTVTPVNDAPTTVANLGLTLAEGGTAVVGGSALRTEDVDNTAAQLVYTVTSLPSHGSLNLSGVALGANGTFTQADLDAGRVSYTHDSSEDSADNFTFTVNDGGFTLASAMFSITITPVNDAPTPGANLGLTLAEGGTAVVGGSALMTNDVDNAAAQLIYTVTNLPSHGSLNLSGVALGANGAFTQADLDAGRVSYTHDSSEIFTDNFTFTVSDGEFPLSSATFALTITPVNDAPTAGANLGLTLPEGGTVVLDGAQLKTNDVDTAATQLVYTVSNLPSHGTLHLNGAALATNGVFTQADLDAGRVGYTHDSSENFADAFDFTVTDGEFPLSSATFAFTITPVNDAPVIAPQNFILYNKAVAGTVVGTVLASDRDAGQQRSFALLGGNGALTINAATGVLTVVNSKLLIGTVLDFVVRVTDNGAPALATDAAISVSLRAADAPPTFAVVDGAATPLAVVRNQVKLLLDERTDVTGTRNGLVIAGLAAADVDEPGVGFPLTMTDRSGAFAFDAATGRLSIRDEAKLDYEKTRSFTLTFTATDHGLVGLPKPTTATLTMTVQLVDRNDTPTVTSAATFKLKENNRANAAVGTIKAVDADGAAPFKNLQYGLVSQRDAAGNDVAIFTIDAARGTLKIAAANALNYEAQPQYTVVVRARDAGGLFTDQTVTVQVIDVNEAVVLTLLDAAQTPTTGLTVPENTANGTLVGYLRIDNPDEARPETFKITVGDNLGKAFAVGAFDVATHLAPITVLNAAKLNYEAVKNGQFSLSFSVGDSGFINNDGSRLGGVSVTKTYKSLVADVNEAPASITWKTAGLPGGSAPIPAGTLFGTALAVDPDKTPQAFNYSLTPAALHNDLFTIDPLTGQLRASLALARRGVFNVSIRVLDSGGLIMDQIFTIKT
ncbi:MAG: hypothetical protein C0483_01505 [Pirellula sp.]|nr:hypothetical protein [Pirellula sp.]